LANFILGCYTPSELAISVEDGDGFPLVLVVVKGCAVTVVVLVTVTCVVLDPIGRVLEDDTTVVAFWVVGEPGIVVFARSDATD
jgi:hypothetical protein